MICRSAVAAIMWSPLLVAASAVPHAVAQQPLVVAQAPTQAQPQEDEKGKKGPPPQRKQAPAAAPQAAPKQPPPPPKSMPQPKAAPLPPAVQPKQERQQERRDLRQERREDRQERRDLRQERREDRRAPTPAPGSAPGAGPAPAGPAPKSNVLTAPPSKAAPPQAQPAPQLQPQRTPPAGFERRAPQQQAQPPAGLPQRTAPAFVPSAPNAPAATAPRQQDGWRGGRGPRDGDRAGTPAPQPPPAARVAPPRQLKDITEQRRVRTEDGGRRRITEEPGQRTIIRQDNRSIIRHDESERFRRFGSDVRTERRPDGRNVTVLQRPGGVQIRSTYDRNGNLLERRRRTRDGREVVIIDNRRVFGRGARIVGAAALIGLTVALAAPRISIPRERYIVDYERATVDDLYETLIAPPVDRLPRRYALEEIRYSHSLRERVRRIDLDAITFEFGSWDVPPDQQRRLERVARAMQRVLERRPDDVFLIEGHSDLVGSDDDNLTLSDRRAESVAIILTEAFGIPPENLVTQGYGEQYPKIDTDGPERLNRRVAIRNVTSLMARGDGPQR